MKQLQVLSFLGGSDGKESACNAGDLGLIPGVGRSPGERNGYPLQYSCLENPMDRGASWPRVHEVTTESDTTEGLTHTHTQVPSEFPLLQKKQAYHTRIHNPASASVYTPGHLQSVPTPCKQKPPSWYLKGTQWKPSLGCYYIWINS